jgi:hypothetical protein
MSSFVPASFQSKYENNVESILQQTKSMLLDCVETTDEEGADKIKVVDLVGNADPQEATERAGDTKYANTQHDGIWLPKRPELYYAELVDNDDQLSTGIELEGAYTKEGANVVNRARDRRILEGMYGSVISGKDGTIVTPFPASMIVPVTTGGASGVQRFNVAKVRAANMLLAKGFVDLSEPRYMTLTAEQSDDLLAEMPVTSDEFRTAYGGMVDENGRVSALLGWTFVPIELSNPRLGTVPTLSLDPSGYRKNLFWVKSGVRVNFWNRLRTDVSPVPTKQLTKQIWAGTTLNATRTQAGKVGIVLNSEVPA